MPAGSPPTLVTSTFSPSPVPPSKPTINVPSSVTIGTRAVLTCSEKDGSPPSEYRWFKDGVEMPVEPKNNRAFRNSSYTLNLKTGELVRMCVCVSCSVMSDSLRPHELQPARLLCPWNSPGKNTGVDCRFPLQGIFPTQGSNLGLLHRRQCKWGWGKRCV